MLTCFLVLPSAAADFTSRDYPVGHLPTSAGVYDFNGDGKLDIAVLNNGGGTADGGISILVGNGDGTFRAAKTFDLGVTVPTSFAVADFNGDGKLDIAVALPTATAFSCSGASVSIFFGNGDGTFQPATHAVDLPSNIAYVAAGDVTADGKADLIVFHDQFDDTCTPPPGYTVFPGKGDGTFQDGTEITGTLDFNGDGIPDFASFAGSGFEIYLGQGNGVFKPLATGPEANSGGVVFADFNQDNKQDQAFLSGKCNDKLCFSKTSFVALALGNGDGTFRGAQQVSPGYPGGPNADDVSWVAFGDFNGDGKRDIAYSNLSQTGISVILGKGDGTFPSLVTLDSGWIPNTFVVADLNGDGRPDAIQVNVGADNISVLLNTFPAGGADLSVGMVANPSPVSATQNLTYMLTVQNLGPEDATNVVLDKYFLGAFETDSYFARLNRVYLLGCQCGEVGCWPLIARIRAERESVVWDCFEQPHRKERDYSGFGPFVFDTEQYREAVAALPPKS